MSFILFLFGRLAPALKHLDLLVSVVYLCLSDLDGLDGMLVCLGELNKPFTNLLQETIRFSQLLVQLVVRGGATAAILGWHGTFRLDLVRHLELR